MSDPIFPFGKHKGYRVSQIETRYLHWVMREITELEFYLREAINAELRQRMGGRAERARKQSRPSGSGNAGARHPAPVDWQDLLGKVRRELAMKHHPDRGGDVATMAGVNLAIDAIEQMVRCA